MPFHVLTLKLTPKPAPNMYIKTPTTNTRHIATATFGSLMPKISKNGIIIAMAMTVMPINVPIEFFLSIITTFFAFKLLIPLDLYKTHVTIAIALFTILTSFLRSKALLIQPLSTHHLS